VPAGAAEPAVRFDAAEADAALAFIATHAESAWRWLCQCEVWRALQFREVSLGVGIPDDEFRSYLLSPIIAKRANALRAALERWSSTDLQPAAARALAYLPPDAAIQTILFPVIKPRPNSFVFEFAGQPALFANLDPVLTGQRFENMVAHELHHIGAFAAYRADAGRLRNAAIHWLTCFGEGLAVLAAAGGPHVHPHALDSAEERARWDRSMQGFADDLQSIERFLLDLLNGRLAETEATRLGYSFYGVEGPWYTVGWRMAVTVEQNQGRAALVRAVEDPRLLLSLYNDSVSPMESRWSRQLLNALAAAR